MYTYYSQIGGIKMIEKVKKEEKLMKTISFRVTEKEYETWKRYVNIRESIIKFARLSLRTLTK